MISRGWPLEPREGDSTDHTWHRGFWYGHGIINGADFWREQGREKTSRLILKSKPRIDDSRVSLDLSMTPPDGRSIGSMRQEYQFKDNGPIRHLDASITIHANSDKPLTFGDTDDGGFAFRLDEAFREDRGARLRNSEGQTGSKQIWGKPAKWTDYSAVIGGAPVGVAMFDHPSNLRHPTRWHARPYGLNAANPFATKSFDKASATDGSYTLPTGRQTDTSISSSHLRRNSRYRRAVCRVCAGLKAYFNPRIRRPVGARTVEFADLLPKICDRSSRC